MKKWLSIILVLVIGLLALIYTCQVGLPKGKIASLESIVPNEAVYYIYSHNLDSKIRDFQASSFFKQIQESEFYNKSVNPILKKAKNKLPFLSELFKKDSGLAIFSLGNIEGRRMGLADFGDFLLLLRIDPKKYNNISKSLADFYLSLAEKNKASFDKYRGLRITNYKLSEAKIVISYALLADVILVSNNEDLIHKAIDLFKDKGKNSLGFVGGFQRMLAKIKKDSLLWGYVNNKKYYQEMLNEYALMSLRSQESGEIKLLGSMKIKPFVNLMNILDRSCFYIDYDELKQGFIGKGYNTFDKSQDTDNMLSVISGRPLDTNTFNLIPKNIIGYYGGNQDFLNSWKFFKKLLSASNEMMKQGLKADSRYSQFKDRIDEMPDFEDFLKIAESYLGLNLEDELLPLLGNNFAVVFAQLKDEGIGLGSDINDTTIPKRQLNMPIIFPQGYGFLEVKDNAGAKALIDKISVNLVNNLNKLIQEQEQKFKQQYGSKEQQDNKGQPLPEEEKEKIRLKQESYRDIALWTFEISDFPAAFITPNYCILDNYIVFSLSPKLTRNIIDIYKSKEDSLNSNYKFESLKDKINSNYANIVFFDSEKLINNFKNSDFYTSLRASPLKMKESSFKELDSLLDILSNFQTFAFTSAMADPETMESTFYVKVKGLL